MDIPDAEYEKRRHAFDLCRWINAQFRQMEETGNLSAIYAERKGKNVKRLIEEAVPISRLALRFSRPGDEVFVTLPPESEGFDAHVEIEGFSPRSFKVEVTTTETDGSNTLGTVQRRQALVPRRLRLTSPDLIRREGTENYLSRKYARVCRCARGRGTACGPAIRPGQSQRSSFEKKTGYVSMAQDTAILAYLTQRLPLSF